MFRPRWQFTRHMHKDTLPDVSDVVRTGKECGRFYNPRGQLIQNISFDLLTKSIFIELPHKPFIDEYGVCILQATIKAWVRQHPEVIGWDTTPSTFYLGHNEPAEDSTWLYRFVYAPSLYSVLMNLLLDLEQTSKDYHLQDLIDEIIPEVKHFLNLAAKSPFAGSEYHPLSRQYHLSTTDPTKSTSTRLLDFMWGLAGRTWAEEKSTEPTYWESKQDRENRRIIGRFEQEMQARITPEQHIYPNRELLRLLASGESVHQVYEWHPHHKDRRPAWSPLHIALYYQAPWDIIKILLQYYANPFQPVNHGTSMTPLELLNGSNQPLGRKQQLADNIVALYSHMDKPITQNITQDYIVAIPHGVVTYLINKQFFIISKLRKLQDIPSPEIEQLKKLFEEKAFKTSVHPFDTEFSGTNKLVEMIYSNCQLVGFILFEKLYSPKEKSIIIVCHYAYIDKAYRNSSLMLLLIKRLDFSIQLLSPLQKVARYFSAINYSVYRLVEKSMHYPKFDPGISQTATMPADTVTRFLYGGKASVYVDTPTAYVADKSTTYEAMPRQASLMEEFFYCYVLGYAFNPLQPDEPSRGATVLYYVSADIYAQFATTLKLTLGIDFFRHIYQLAKHLQGLVTEFKLENKPHKFAAFMQTDLLFWQNRKIISLSEQPSLSMSIPNQL